MSSSGNNDSNNDRQTTAEESLVRELLDFCQSKVLTEAGLHKIIQRHNIIRPAQLKEYDFIFEACNNEIITEGIIQCLLKYFPNAASATNNNGWTPLHVACDNKNVTLDIIQFLIEAAPDTARSVNNNGSMPLHCLCDNEEVNEKAAIEILKLLIDEYPAALRHADKDGDLPIHMACTTKTPEFCRVLIDAAPDSIQSVNNEGGMPIHCLCDCTKVNEGTASQVLKLLIEIYPEALRCADEEYGDLPIHIACVCNSPEFCQILIDAAPDSVSSVNNKGATPLHSLCDYTEVDKWNAMQILKILIEKYPEAVRRADSDGDLPIHVACLSKSLEFCQVLIDAYPDSVRSVNNDGGMPLHILCNNEEVNEEIVIRNLKMLIEKYPKAVQHAYNSGDLPIHLAAQCGRSPEFCRVLIEAYPGSERMTNAYSALPIHWACWSGTLPTVEYLCTRFPDCIKHASTQGHYPIHDAIRGTIERENPADVVEIVKFFLGCDLDVKLQRFRGISLLQFASEKEFDDSNIEAGIEIIKVIYDAHPEAIEDNGIVSDFYRFHQEVQEFLDNQLFCANRAKDHRLMTTADDNGRLPLHNALQNNVRLGSIKLLVKGNPSAIRNFDNNGLAPLHVACEHHCSPSVVQYLLGLDKRTLRAVDYHNNTALHYACCGAKYDTIALLLEKYDAASVSKRNTHKKLPIELLWESDAVKDRESIDYTDTIFRLLKAYPETLRNVGRRQLQSSLAACPSQIGNGKKRKYGSE